MPRIWNVRPDGLPRDTLAAKPARPLFSSVVLILLLAAGVSNAQAVVPSPRIQTSPEAPVENASPVGGCPATPAAARAAVRAISDELHSHGMALHALCQAATKTWVVQVKVVDGVKAAKVVRGPLADGYEVDMGTPSGVLQAGAQWGAPGFSPDVQHNREWLRGVMARHQFASSPQAWWQFSEQGTSANRSSAKKADVAAR